MRPYKEKGFRGELPAAVLIQEMLRENLQVISPFTQRRKVHGELGYPVEKVLPE